MLLLCDGRKNASASELMINQAQQGRSCVSKAMGCKCLAVSMPHSWCMCKQGFAAADDGNKQRVSL